MKSYPSIGREVVNDYIYAFDKLDGTNIRCEWNRKHKDFTKFGTKAGLIDKTHEQFGESVHLIYEYRDTLNKIFFDKRWEKVVCFFEFFGKNSFAGLHENEPHKVVLFDVSVHKHGLLEPNTFRKIFEGSIPTPEMLYYGKPNSELIEQVSNNSLEGMTFEGVVCKGKYVSPGMPLMFKLKSEAWIKKVKERYSDPKILEQLL